MTPEQAVRRLLEEIDPSPDREGLKDTPDRVVRALREMTRGYKDDPVQILSKTFDLADDPTTGATYKGIVILRQIPFSSLCEHHLLPFSGHASVAYVPGPGGRVVGLSKLARLVDCYARRLQCQERLTAQVVDAVHGVLGALGAAVVVQAEHQCMMMRGVSKAGAVMVTSDLRGVFRNDASARAEVMDLLQGG